MVGVNEENDVGLSDFFAQCGSVLWTGGGIDDGGGNILGCPGRRWYRNLGQDGLYLVGDEDALDKRGDQAGLAGPLIAANTDSNCYNVLG